MPINPNMVLDFAQNLGQQKPLTQLSGGLVQVIEQKRAEKAREAAEQQYQQSMSAFQTERTPETYANWMNAANAVGRFEEANKMNEGMDQAHREQKVRRNSELIGPLMAGDSALFTQNLKEQATALAASDDPRDQRDAQTLQWLGYQAEQGNEQQVLDFLMASSADTPEGQAMVSSFLEQRQDRRQGMMDQASYLSTVNSNPFNSEADRQRAVQAFQEMEGVPFPLGEEVAKMFSVASMNGVDSGEMTDRLQSLRKEYMGYAEGFKESIYSADAIEALVNSDADTGMLDAAILDFFNRVSNPDAVVRQSDVARTTAAQGVWQQVANFKSKLESGTSFTEPTRRAMLDVVNTVKGLAEKAEFNAGDSINSSLERMSGGNEELLEQLQDEVYGPGKRGETMTPETIRAERPSEEQELAMQTVEGSDLYEYLTDEEKKALPNMSREEMRKEFPSLFEEETTQEQSTASASRGAAPQENGELTSTQRQALNRQIAEWNGVPVQDIAAMTLDQIKSGYGNGWKAWAEREGIGQGPPAEVETRAY